MSIAVSPRINTLPARRARASNQAGKMVLQCEFAIASARDKKHMVETSAFNTCVVLSLFSAANQVGGMAHFDLNTDVRRSLQDVIIPEFRKRECRDLKASIVGGMQGHSDQLVRAVRDSLKSCGASIAGFDIFDPAGYPGLIMSARSGRLYDPASSLVRPEEEMLPRLESAMQYLIYAPVPRLIRLVG